jgi:hypothetical protein
LLHSQRGRHAAAKPSLAPTSVDALKHLRKQALQSVDYVTYGFSVPASKVKRILAMNDSRNEHFGNEKMRSAFAAIHFFGLPEAGSPAYR